MISGSNEQLQQQLEYTLLKPDCHSRWISKMQSDTPSLSHYLTKMGIKTVPHPPYSQYLAPCDIWLFPKLRGCCYKTTEMMKEAVTKLIDTITQ